MWIDLYYDLSIFTFISCKVTVDPIANNGKDSGKAQVTLCDLVGCSRLRGSVLLFVDLTKSFFLVQYRGSLSPPAKFINLGSLFEF